jgi:hypothetical protein
MWKKREIYWFRNPRWIGRAGLGVLEIPFVSFCDFEEEIESNLMGATL